MRTSQLIELLKIAIPAGRPVLVTGKPGIAKSAVVEQATEAAGAHFILDHPAVADPTDAKGIPWGSASGDVEFRPIGQVKRVLAATERTVWFLDDLGQATPAVQAAYMPWLLARECAGHRLPDCVTIIAATNRRTDRAGVGGLLEPVKSRFATIVELEAHIADWSAWAVRAGMPAELIAFLRFRPDLLSAFEPSADLVNSPCPRTWVNAAAWLSVPDRAVRNEAIAGAVGVGAATEFLAFLDLFAQLPSIDAILIDPNSAPLPSEPSARYATTTALALRTTDATFPRVARYAERLADAGAGDFAALLIRDVLRRIPSVQSTPAFVNLACGNLSTILTGVN